MPVNISVIICTYNPDANTLNKVFRSLIEQTLAAENWELIIVDNNSKNPVRSVVDLNWKADSTIVVEPKPGLSFARIAGVSQSKNNLIVFVDDDNILDQNYLLNAASFHESNKNVGCFGGKSLPQFETSPPTWFSNVGINLGCQDFGNELHISNFNGKVKEYPEKAPIGTGMVITKSAFMIYLNDMKGNIERLKLGRKANELTSGEDNDIILTIVKHGFETAYVPDLVIYHYIPKFRYSKEYLQRMAFESNRSWIKVLHIHNLHPWAPILKWTLTIRKIKAWFLIKAWKNETTYIKWRGACGKYEGLSEIK